ncbi:class F sortase [Microtetraspora sp. AC03309]|uniref:class F sortase n=1 Tax=Microtetraspora sp. AC03309 TaxID=2779376 RepID=UPI001E283412|nr:class F sortase [Microtetraspora sp. AC03309]
MGRPLAVVVAVLGLLTVATVTVFALDRSSGAAPVPPAPPASAAIPDAEPTPSTARAMAPASPVLLEIPRIGVRTGLMTLGKNPDGTLEVPPLSRVDEAGWYRLGPSPGATGPAVIVGHVDSKQGPGVFFRLGDLRPGDRVKVSRQDGTLATFQVDSLESVPKDHFPTSRVYGMTDFPALRLITCGGTFDRGSGHYLDNVIVYAHLVSAK